MKIPNSFALAMGSRKDLLQFSAAQEPIQSGAERLEIVLGIGQCHRPPARVAGFAVKVSQLLTLIRTAFNVPEIKVRIFSTEPKLRFLAGANISDCNPVPSLLALVAALRATGYEGEINVDSASSSIEVDEAYLDQGGLTKGINSWLIDAANSNANGAPPLSYAREHAAASMFGDLGTVTSVWIGPRPEARFFAVRNLIRKNARAAGVKLPANIGFVISAAKVAWYQRVGSEPLLSHLASSTPEKIHQDLMSQSNPKHGGNSGIKSEARSSKTLLSSSQLVIAANLLDSGDSSTQLSYLRSLANVGKNLTNLY